MKQTKYKCMVVHTVKKPKLMYRWLKFRAYLKRLKAVEKELGGELHCC